MYLTSNHIYFLGKLFTTDLDGTILIGAKDNIKRNLKDRSYDTHSFKKTFSTVKRKGFDDVLINTGRNFSELSEIKELLQDTDAPINAISLEDGKRLLKKPLNLTPEQWMAQLFGGKVNYTYFCDKNWEDINSAPLKQIAEFLTKEMGYIHRKNEDEKSIFSKDIEFGDVGVEKISGNPKWRVEIIPPGITVKVKVYNKGDSKINLQEYNSYLSSKVLNFLERKGYDISKLKSEEETCYINKFKRADINKKTVADFFKSTLPDDTQEIRAGNASNDYEMLNDDSIQAIVVGDDEHLKRKLAGKSNITYVEEGHLDKGIRLALRA